MKKCVDFLADLKQALEPELGRPARDADVARALHLTRAGVLKIQRGGLFGDQTIARVAKLLGIEASYVRKCVDLQRAQRDVQRLEGQLQQAVKRLATGTLGALLVAGVIGALLRQFDISGFTAALGILAAPINPFYTLCVLATLIGLALATAAARRAAIAGRHPSIPQTLMARPGRPVWGAL